MGDKSRLPEKRASDPHAHNTSPKPLFSANQEAAQSGKQAIAPYQKIQNMMITKKLKEDRSEEA